MTQRSKAFRVGPTSSCPRCGAPLILIARDFITTAGLVRFLWLCPFDRGACNSAVVQFPDGIAAGAVSIEDEDFRQEIVARIRDWYEKGNRAECRGRNREMPEGPLPFEVTRCDYATENRHGDCSTKDSNCEACEGPPKPESPAEEGPGKTGETP